MVLRRYIDFLILLIPTPLVSVLFCSSIPTFLFIFKNVFRSCYNYNNKCIVKQLCVVMKMISPVLVASSPFAVFFGSLGVLGLSESKIHNT